ncbi:glutamate 5-kinase [Patescibacteria group bacterium]|nr:glutamate 5-kinase [Patescibacteria group bacterium]
MYKKLVVKIGSNVITNEDGLLNEEVFSSLVDQIATLRKKGVEIILVTSGATAAGRSIIKIPQKTPSIVERQVLASFGQVKLMKMYQKLFAPYEILCSQVLATKEDFRDRLHYLNMKNCFEGLIEHGAIPIVNENDVISVTELMFTDNDELAGLIASMMKTNALILLTSVDGIYNGDPKKKTSRVIQYVTKDTDLSGFITKDRSSFGRGGMHTKIRIAKKLSSLGITTHIANGKQKDILLNIENNGTSFVPDQCVIASNVKRWIAHAEGYEKGEIIVDEGAEKALKEKTASLLPVGIKKILGEFERGDIIKILNVKDHVLGYGQAQYGSKTAKKYRGKKDKRALIHQDYIFIHHD